MDDKYKFKNGYSGHIYPTKDGKSQMNEGPEISYEIYYRDGLDIQYVTKQLIYNFIDSVEAWARCLEKEAAEEAVKEKAFADAAGQKFKDAHNKK
jgi:hypothetical protein